jgi:hypothetical protein
MFVESYQITSEQIVELIQTFKTGLDMFVELHQFISEVLKFQDKFQQDCRIVSILIRGSRLSKQVLTYL